MRNMVYVIVRADNDQFIAVANTDEAARNFLRTSGWNDRARVIAIETLDEPRKPRRRRSP